MMRNLFSNNFLTEKVIKKIENIVYFSVENGSEILQNNGIDYERWKNNRVSLTLNNCKCKFSLKI